MTAIAHDRLDEKIVAAMLRHEDPAISALLQWLEQHPVVNENGDAMHWTDGRPVALDVLEVVNALRHSVSRESR